MSRYSPQPGVTIESRARLVLDMPEEDGRALLAAICAANKARQKLPDKLPKGFRLDRVEEVS